MSTPLCPPCAIRAIILLIPYSDGSGRPIELRYGIGFSLLSCSFHTNPVYEARALSLLDMQTREWAIRVPLAALRLP